MIREELVLRVAILAERFSPNLQWYVDTILKLIALAGDYVSNQVRAPAPRALLGLHARTRSRTRL